MNDKAYGLLNIGNSGSDWLACAREEIEVLGYTIIPDIIDQEQLELTRDKLDDLYARQEQAYGAKRLVAINDSWTVRAPLLYDDFFLLYATQPRILQLVTALLGEYFILNLQNAILNNSASHQQTAWHRDIPYQDWVPSKPMAINVLYAIDDFTLENGATLLLPFSHRLDKLPSWEFFERHKIVAEVTAGSAIVFNSWVVHRAGNNVAGGSRRAINHLYTTPIVKQQYDFPRALRGKWSDDVVLARLLGYDSQVAKDDVEFRARRSARLKEG